ncbi:MAG: hypothetical protein MUE34_03255 [Acidimicrobiales bacterium]|jgi:hypothetical protein|nr:hypothetical protein [Acidimicrobiales bacterium]
MDRGTAATTARRWVIPVTAALALTMVGQGVVAQLADTVRVDGNAISSNAIVVGDGLVLGAGLDSVCPSDTVYGPGPLAGQEVVVDVNEDLGNGMSTELCIRNDGPDPLVLSVTVPVTSDLELGACEPTEIAAGDTTCGAGAAGEMAEVGTLVRWAQCTGIETTGPLSSGTTPVAAGTIAPGQVCFVNVSVEIQRPADLWQTDRLTYDVVVEGVPA